MMNDTLSSGLGGIKHFDWVEYIVFATMLTISVLIGIYFGFIKNQNTVSEYLLGSRQMSLFPVTMSLIASQISSFTLLAVPSEVYTFGAAYCTTAISNIACALITLVIFLPVFYKLQLLSMFEYLELRFSRTVRVYISALYTVMLLTFMPLVIFGPSLALNQASGLNLYLIAISLSVICIFYTTIGGLKAVVWTDAIQGSFMLISVIIVTCLGINKAGGFLPVFDINARADRLEFFNMNPDPTERLSFWTALISVSITWAGYVAVAPACIQRFNSLPTYRQAQMSVIYLGLGVNIFAVPCMIIGLIIYAVYKDCDPLSAGFIVKGDQILPYFVMDVAGHIKGLSGMFIVGLCSAALSTLSTGLNSLAGTIFEDFVAPHLSGKVNDARANHIMKIIVVASGAFCVGFITIIEHLGSILELATTFGGVTLGAVIGVFTLGMLFPTSNNKGAMVGGVVSFVLTLWMMIGHQMAVNEGMVQYPPKPASVEGCLTNITLVTKEGPKGIAVEDVWFPYKISLFNYGLIGSSLCIVVGMIVSYMTGPRKLGDVHPDLINPLLHRFLPKKDYAPLPLNDVKKELA